MWFVQYFFRYAGAYLCEFPVFLALAIASGLTMAIANPSQDLLMRCAYAADLVMNKKGADLVYIDQTMRLNEKKRIQEINRL